MAIVSIVRNIIRWTRRGKWSSERERLSGERIRGDVAASSVTLCSCSRVSQAQCGFTWIERKGGKRGARREREREEGRSGWPGKTGRTGFLGRVGESLYSVSLFLRSELAGLSSEHLRSLYPLNTPVPNLWKYTAWQRWPRCLQRDVVTKP